ncbi:MAG: peptide-methionine (S)-S-oxide reductase MsrA [Saprospiraceae bacterium]|nr:peptide-methionine (S)-S-oxide reductase MsrA [Saprospiraceae bacterium]
MRKKIFLYFIAVLGASCHSAQNSAPAMQQSTNTTTETTSSGQTELATLGGGCFWCVEAIYQDLNGVLKVESGYSGGNIDNPSYREVCTGTTGHAEVIQVTFDPALVSFDDILHIFFTVHDPTTLNRQGNDSGTQYRSVIYYHSEAQRQTAEKVKVEAQEAWDDPIVTEISAFDKFYKAEGYHQNYFKDNPNQPYCSYIIAPKVKKFREKYQSKLKQ